MKDEIDRDFYCSADRHSSGYCIGSGGCCSQSFTCPSYHRKYPTPEQYKEEYDEEYPDEAAVYWTHIVAAGREPTWNISTYEEAKKENKNASGYSNVSVIVICACTPFGKPPNDWRIEDGY